MPEASYALWAPAVVPWNAEMMRIQQAERSRRHDAARQGAEMMRDSTSPETDTRSGLSAVSGDQAPAATRRSALRLASGGVALALLAARAGDRAIAQEASPTAENSTSRAYAVMRTRVVKADTSIENLTMAIQDGLVPIMRQIPGYIDYYVVQNFETRQRTSVSIYADKAGTDESTRQAAAFLNGQGLADSYEDVEPIITEGEIVVTSR